MLWISCEPQNVKIDASFVCVAKRPCLFVCWKKSIRMLVLFVNVWFFIEFSFCFLHFFFFLRFSCRPFSLSEVTTLCDSMFVLNGFVIVWFIWLGESDEDGWAIQDLRHQMNRSACCRYDSVKVQRSKSSGFFSFQQNWRWRHRQITEFRTNLHWSIPKIQFGLHWNEEIL